VRFSQAAAVLGALLCGCASWSELDCRMTDWYDAGFRDAIFGLQRQENVYEQRCAAQGVKVDMARYVKGWTEGKYEADSRNPQPIH
jgi:hypothetical protein